VALNTIDQTKPSHFEWHGYTRSRNTIRLLLRVVFVGVCVANLFSLLCCVSVLFIFVRCLVHFIMWYLCIVLIMCIMFLFFIESMIIKYTLTCFTFQTNIITVDLEYIDIFPYSTLIKQHQLCLSNFIHVFITINLFNLCQHFRISMNCQRFSSN
jgi:hypothetical protein